jgi:hypothetical protein
MPTLSTETPEAIKGIDWSTCTSLTIVHACTGRALCGRTEADMVDGPTIGQSVWVADDSAPEGKVRGCVVSVGTGESLIDEAGSFVVQVSPGHVRILLLANRGTVWAYAPD